MIRRYLEFWNKGFILNFFFNEVKTWFISLFNDDLKKNLIEAVQKKDIILILIIRGLR